MKVGIFFRIVVVGLLYVINIVLGGLGKLIYKWVYFILWVFEYYLLENINSFLKVFYLFSI